MDQLLSAMEVAEGLPMLCAAVLFTAIAIGAVHYMYGTTIVREAPCWRDTRYARWQQHEQHREPGLGLALQRLAFASLIHPRLAEDASEAANKLPADVVGLVGEAVSLAVGFWRARGPHGLGDVGRVLARRHEARVVGR